MKAVGYTRFGDPEVFEALKIQTPDLTGDQQVIIETLAVGLNNFERIQRMGKMGGQKWPLIPGRDVVGKVVQKSDDVTQLELGDTVIAHAGPAYAEYVKVSMKNLVKKPDNVSISQAVGIVTPGITAYNAVTAFTQVRAGDRVLINGVTGGVGIIAAQIAQTLGAYVAGIGSSRNLATLQSLSLDEVGLYDKENVNDKFSNQFDVVINVAMNGNNQELIGAVIRNGGRAASVGEATTLAAKPAVTFEHIRPLDSQHDLVALRQLSKLLAQGSLKVPIFKTLPLSLPGVIAGHRLLDEPHAPGRIVLIKS